ncbi:uncharacterized protein RJT21DRAFT_122892 [Scheffersomyces amazonensis]|uniref:uncharacterized protein n=1 Tax=Scheffersomyces amazonensis TaxID=1078765 RepID=UPI00315D77F2
MFVVRSVSRSTRIAKSTWPLCAPYVLRRHFGLSSIDIDTLESIPDQIIIDYFVKAHLTQTNDIPTVEKLSSLVSKLTPDVQEQIFSEKVPSSLLLNIKLHTLISELAITENYAQVFKFIISYSSQLQSELVETFLFNLLQLDNLTATTSLLHVIYEATPNLRLSNQFWGLFVNKVNDSGHYLGSILIYHHLIDHYSFYDDQNYTTYVQDNSNIPFLLTPTSLENLTIIFKNNNDPSRIKGLGDYFKRFYSYANNRMTLKTLRVCLVEAYSDKNDLELALEAFKVLAFSIRYGIYNNKRPDESVLINWHKINKFSKIVNASGYFWSRNNIEFNANQVPPFPKSLLSNIDIAHNKITSAVYNPDYERNMYTNQLNNRSNPLINGSIQTNDLPIFQSLITSHIKTIKQQDLNSIIPQLTTLLGTCHFQLTPFIINGLCQNQLYQQAYTILTQLPQQFSRIHLRNLIKSENFFIMFHAFKLYFRQNNSNSNSNSNNHRQASDIFKLMNQTLQFYIDMDRKFLGKLAGTVYSSYIDAALAYGQVTLDDIQFSLDMLNQKAADPMMIDEGEYEKFESLCSQLDPNPYQRLFQRYKHAV